MMIPGFSVSVQSGAKGLWHNKEGQNGGFQEDITAELSKLTNDISAAELSHGEVDVFIYELDLLCKSLFQLHFDSNVDSNSFNGTLIYYFVIQTTS